MSTISAELCLLNYPIAAMRKDGSKTFQDSPTQSSDLARARSSMEATPMSYLHSVLEPCTSSFFCQKCLPDQGVVDPEDHSVMGLK